jgi:hypothetical protein
MAAINPNTLFKTNALGLRPSANKAAGIASQNAMLTNQQAQQGIQKASAEMKQKGIETYAANVREVAGDLARTSTPDHFNLVLGQALESGKIDQGSFDNFGTAPQIQGWRGILLDQSSSTQSAADAWNASQTADKETKVAKGVATVLNDRTVVRDDAKAERAADAAAKIAAAQAERFKVTDAIEKNKIAREITIHDLDVIAKKNANSDHKIGAEAAALVKKDKQSMMGDVFDMVNELLDPINANNLASATGYIDEMFPTVSEDVRDIEKKLDLVRTFLTVDNLKLMQGILTDRDIIFLSKVGGGVIESGLSDDKVKEGLNELKERFRPYSSLSTKALIKKRQSGMKNRPVDPRASAPEPSESNGIESVSSAELQAMLSAN